MKKLRVFSAIGCVCGFIALLLLLCSSCIMNSNITLGGVSTLQSPRDNEAGTSSKQEVKEVQEVEDMNSTGILPWLLDKTLGHK